MTEWKLFDGDVPRVSTAEFHEHRERAPHLEQAPHQGRLHAAAAMIRGHASDYATLSDLGCGDGGLLSLVQRHFPAGAWGYDFQPSNAAGWAERGVTAYALDFTARLRELRLGSVVVMTEVLEHMADPHLFLAWLFGEPMVDVLVCSSPVNENDGMHDECHAWAWDFSGYSALVSGAGFSIVRHQVVGNFQVVEAVT